MSGTVASFILFFTKLPFISFFASFLPVSKKNVTERIAMGCGEMEGLERIGHAELIVI